MPVSEASSGGAAVARSGRGGWSDVEEARLLKIVLAKNVRSGRTSATVWDEIADDLARDGQALGFPRRTGSSCRHRAIKLGVFHQKGEAAASVIPASAITHFPALQQRGFGEVETRNLIADVFERVAKEIRGA